jgi:plasmid stabilization system protein ParE
MTTVIYAPEALDDVQGIIDFLAEQDPQLAEKFETHYGKALEKVRAFPQAWPKVTRRVRVKIISKKFLYGIFYQYSRKTIFIGAVVHLSRRRSRWSRRFRR